MSLEIEHDVPLPEGGTGAKKGYTAALRKLKKRGDSVLIPGKKSTEMSALIKFAGLTGKVTMRTLPDGVRVWRIR